MRSPIFQKQSNLLPTVNGPLLDWRAGNWDRLPRATLSPALSSRRGVSSEADRQTMILGLGGSSHSCGLAFATPPKHKLARHCTARALGNCVGRGHSSDALSSAFSNGGQMRRSRSTRLQPTTVVGPTVVRKKTDRRHSAESFARAARANHCTPRDLADAADVTIEAAKLWLDARRAPNAANLINMAMSLDFVWKWFQEEAAIGNRIAQARGADGALMALYQFAKHPGPDGDVARVFLAAIRKADGVGE